MKDLGFTITNISQHVKGGILIFFPSYKLMEEVYQIWAISGALKEMEQIKNVYKEPKQASEYQLVIDRYYNSIYEDEKKGAVLLGVCRGRISEGLDFSDNAARMVIIIGIPYPQMNDSRVKLKKHFLDSKITLQKKIDPNGFQESLYLTGKDWYS